MKIEWLIADVTAAVPPDRAERDILGMIFDIFFVNSGLFVVESHFVTQEYPFDS